MSSPSRTSLPTGYLCLVLHAHLPFVRHPEAATFLEEDWLFEAITETYVPLLQALDRLHRDGVPGRLTISISPPLAAMLADPLLQSRYIARLDSLRELASREVARHRGRPPLGPLAEFHRDLFDSTHRFVVDAWGGQLLGAFRQAHDRGQVELITCNATHGILPLLANDAARRAQIRVGVESHRRFFDEDPPGMWLAECAYDHGIDRLLAESGVQYTFVDTHGVQNADPAPVYATAAPIATEAGVAVFGRDLESSRQVWSSEAGYPGDPVYREFYRDLGYDGDYEQIRPFLHPDGVRRNLGIKYHRVTGKVDLGAKDFYDPAAARDRARDHAGNFHFNRCAQTRWLRGGMDRPPVVVSPYDAELFGHWWFEGPWFIEDLFRVAARYPDALALITPGDYVRRHPENQQCEPSPSTWGLEGYSSVWLNGENAWMYRHQHRAERRLARLVQRIPHAGGKTKSWLDAAARELLLAESSDWAFILTTGTAKPYALRRFREHVHRFHRLADAVEQGHAEPGLLASVRTDATLFPWIDYRVFTEGPTAAEAAG